MSRARTKTASHYNPALRGYHALYRENEVNRCPGCGRSHWYVGRISAECGFCGTALPLADTAARGRSILTDPYIANAA